ncbi:beta-lactamase/transpeptidase-like protein, partial [Favolaschia claudopus]
MSPKTLSASQKDALNRILIDAVASKSSPALFFGVTNVDGPIYMRGEGTKLVDDRSSDAVDEDTVMWFCSQTKLITSIAALQLIEQGKISLDTPAETVLSELANPVVVTAHDENGHIKDTRPAKGKITLGQLLNHTSGLDYVLDGTTPLTGPGAGLAAAYQHNYEGEGVSKFFEMLKGGLPGVPLRFEPGTSFAYGLSTDCVGFIVERLSGKSLEQYFQDHIFAPLNITSMSFSLRPDMEARLLPLTYRSKKGTLEEWNGPDVINQDRTKVTVNLGGVGLYGSQKDYLTILRHLLQINGNIRSPFGILHSNKALKKSLAGSATTPILSRASVNKLFEPSIPHTAEAQLFGILKAFQPHFNFQSGATQFGAGLCLNTADIPGMRRNGSGVWGGWASTSFFIDPDAGVAAVLGTQIAPMADEMYSKTYTALERALYAGW